MLASIVIIIIIVYVVAYDSVSETAQDPLLWPLPRRFSSGSLLLKGSSRFRGSVTIALQ